MGVLPRRWKIPEGLRVLPDGSWHIGDQPVRHQASLRFFKQRLVFEPDGAFVSDRGRRVGVTLEGPPFEVRRLEFAPEHGSVIAHLDDGSSEALAGDGSLWMDPTGRFCCLARGGQSQALFSRGAHQALLERAEQEGGEFFLRVGERRIPIAT